MLQFRNPKMNEKRHENNTADENNSFEMGIKYRFLIDS